MNMNEVALLPGGWGVAFRGRLPVPDYGFAASLRSAKRPSKDADVGLCLPMWGKADKSPKELKEGHSARAQKGTLSTSEMGGKRTLLPLASHLNRRDNQGRRDLI